MEQPFILSHVINEIKKELNFVFEQLNNHSTVLKIKTRQKIDILIYTESMEYSETSENRNFEK